MFASCLLIAADTDEKGPVFPPQELIQPPSPETNKLLDEMLSTAATLGLIIAVILIIAWFLKRMVNTRMVQANETSNIQILERRILSPKTSLYLIEANEKTMLIAETHSGITFLSQVDQQKRES